MRRSRSQSTQFNQTHQQNKTRNLSQLIQKIDKN